MEIGLEKRHLEELDELINSGELTRFLVDKLCNFETVAFVLQSILNAELEAEKQLNKMEE